MLPTSFRFLLVFLSAMALHLMFPTLPADVDEPGGFEAWLELAEDGLLKSVFEYWEDEGGPLVTVDASTPLGAFTRI